MVRNLIFVIYILQNLVDLAKKALKQMCFAPKKLNISVTFSQIFVTTQYKYSELMILEILKLRYYDPLQYERRKRIFAVQIFVCFCLCKPTKSF